MPMLLDADANTLTVPETAAPEAGEIMDIVGAAVLVTVIATKVVVWTPALSVATAMMLWPPFDTVVVFHEIEYGDTVTGDKRLVPSNLNWMLWMPTLLDAVAVIRIVPDTVAPEAGAVIDTVGGTTLLTVTVIPAELIWVPAVSVTTAVSVWAPFDTVVVSQDTEYGDAVSREPRLVPSNWNWTLAIPTVLEGLAETVIVPETVAPAVGAVSDTVVVVTLLTVTVTAAEVVCVPAVSVTIAVRLWLPFAIPVVFHDAE
jgi:hypothetical protein